MTSKAHSEGKLQVCQQVENYMFQLIEFETINFLNYTVETYKCQGDKGRKQLRR
jgi:hypothetical protein